MFALDVLVDALEARRVRAFTTEAVLVLDVDLVVLAREDRGLRGLRQLLPRRLHIEAEFVAEALEQTVEVLRDLFAARPGGDGSGTEAEVFVRDDEVFVDLQACADAVAGGAGSEGRVEGERARFDLVDRQRVLVRARHVFGEGAGRAFVDEVDVDASVCQSQCGLDGVGQPRAHSGFGDEAVDDHGDRVLVLLLQGRRFAQADLLAVDDGSGEALRLQVGEEVDEFALAGADDGSEDEELRALLEFEQLVDDLLRGLLRDDLTADGAVRDADPCPQQAEEVIDLGDRADGRTRVARGRLLVDRHRRRQALDEVDIGLVHLPEEHPGIGGQGFDVATLSLGEDRVEGQR